MSQIVFDADGKAGILTGINHEEKETVVWLGKPEVIDPAIDARGDGTPAYSTSFPIPEGEGPAAYVDGAGAPSAVPTGAAGADAGYTDNHDGTFTRNSDGARGTFGPSGFTATETASEATYSDNHDGTYTRDSDGTRGSFGPNGFQPIQTPEI